jgi:hypothetical protein
LKRPLCPDLAVTLINISPYDGAVDRFLADDPPVDGMWLTFAFKFFDDGRPFLV